VVRQLADSEDDDDSQYHPCNVSQSTHALYAGFLLVPVECFHTVHKQHVEDADSHEWYEETDHQEQVCPRLTITNRRPQQLTCHLHRQLVTLTFGLFWVKVIVVIRSVIIKVKVQDMLKFSGQSQKFANSGRGQNAFSGSRSSS